MKRKAGFTLIELLIVMSLVALIGMALYAMFSSAINMMHRVSRTEVAEDVDVFFEKLDREISSQVTFKGIPFDGKETSVSFPSRIGLDKKAPLSKGIGRVSYFFDESHRAFARRQENMSQIYKREEVEPALLLEGVSDVKFEYFVYRKVEKIFEWVSVWNPLENEGAIPSAVKVEFEYVWREERHEFKRTLVVPIAESTR